MTLLLSRTEVMQILNISDTIEILNTAFADLSNQNADMPAHIPIIAPNHGGVAYFMPAYLMGMGALGAKVITFYEDNPKNFTRFWVIGKKSPGGTGEDKTSIMLSFKDGVGALHRTLKPFAKHKINLTKIESRPFKQRPWEYIFFIDLEGHTDDNHVKRALEEVKDISQFFKILGSYPKRESKA